MIPEPWMTRSPPQSTMETTTLKPKPMIMLTTKTVNAPSQAQVDFEKGSYHNILLFLWGVILQKDEAKACALTNCFKQATIEWTEEQHRIHLNLGPQLRNIPNHPTQHLIQNQSQNMGPLTRLANAIAGRGLNDSLDREEGGGPSSSKRYSRVPEYVQNIMKMLIIMDNHTASDIPDLIPTTNFIKLTQLNDPFIQSLLIREANNRGLMYNPALGLCQNLRNIGISNTPKITPITNLSYLSSFYPNQATTIHPQNCYSFSMKRRPWVNCLRKTSPS